MLFVREKWGDRPDSNRRLGDHGPECFHCTTGTAGTAGTEPAASRLTSERSTQLSYASWEGARAGFEPAISSS